MKAIRVIVAQASSRRIVAHRFKRRHHHPCLLPPKDPRHFSPLQTMIHFHSSSGVVRNNSDENADEGDDNDDDDGETDERTKSIAEAIAAYKAEASLQMAEKIEEVKRETEQATRARMEQDLILQQRKKAFEEWERNVALAREREENEAKQAAVVSADRTADPTAHPVLGSVVQDLGYKRLHIVPA